MKKIAIYITEESSVQFTSHLIKRFIKDYPEMKFCTVAYTDGVKSKIEELDERKIFGKIITQSTYNSKDYKGGLTNDEEYELERIENTYSRKTIWEYVHQDRYLTLKKSAILFDYGRELPRSSALKVIIQRFRLLEEWLSIENPEAVIYISHDYGTSIAAVLYEVAQKLNIKTLVPNFGRFRDYFAINNDIYGSFPAFDEKLKINLEKKELQFDDEVVDYYNSFRSSNEQAFYINRKKTNNYKEIRNRLKTFFKLLTKSSFSDINKPNQFVFLIALIRDKILINFRKFSIKYKDYFSQEIDLNDKFIFFPMHYEPELVLLLQSQMYTNQFEVIRQTARLLPDNMMLYVKENPTSLGRRSFSYYKKLKSIPNVKLIHPCVNSHDLIKKSTGVITIIGTAGYEATLLDKPAITLSNAYYNCIPSIFKCTSLEKITSIVKQFEQYKPNKREQLATLQTLKNISVEVNLIELIKWYALENKETNVLMEGKFELYYQYLNKHISEK